METYEAVVLGTGAVGSAVLYHLAGRGIRSIGVDRFSPPHEYGSTHGHTRIIRQAYFEHPDYVPLLFESYRLWRALEDRTNQRLLFETGLIQIGPSAGVVVPGVLRASELHSIPAERLSAIEVEQRWPGLRVPGDLMAAFDPRAGYLLVEACVHSQLAAAAAHGARLMTDVEVYGWTAGPHDVRIATSAGELVCGCLVITAGAWAGSILADLGLQLSVLRKSMFWFAADTQSYDASNGFPVFLLELPDGVFYGFPRIDERGVKVAEHSGGHIVAKALDVDRAVDDAEKNRLIRVMSDHLPGLSRSMTAHSVCLYTMTPDRHFIVDRHPDHPNVCFAAGLSGHGFKFAPVLALALADLACDGRTNLPIDFLSLKRFQ